MRAIRFAVLLALLVPVPALAQLSFVAFESGPVRPLALSADGSELYATNIPDNTLEIFKVNPQGLVHDGSVPVGMEPVAVAVRSNGEIWVVNHLSDSVSIVDAASRRVVRTLLVGDEPRDIVITDPDGVGVLGERVFITTAHRGQQRSHASIAAVPGAGDPQLTTAGVGRADVWVFEADAPGSAYGGTPLEIVVLFGDTPRALAVSNDGSTVYAAVFHSGNKTAVVSEGMVCDGFGAAPCSGDGVTSPNGLAGGNVPGGNPGPSDNAATEQAPEVSLVVQYDDGSGEWRDEGGRNWSNGIRFTLPDYDVFEIDAATLSSAVEHSGVGTILFNMAVNPVNGNLYVSNTESKNLTRFEGYGDHGGSTVQGNLAQSQVTVISGSSVKPRHLNRHIDYSELALVPPAFTPNPSFDTTAKNHSLATPLDLTVSSDGATLYVTAFGSSKIGVFDTADLEDDSLFDDVGAEFDPAAESANYLSVSGGGPAGLALDETNNRLYVLTRFDNSVSVVDLGTDTEVNHIPLHNPEPDNVVVGRPMLYDAFKTSANGEASCSSCHIFGDFDSLAWDLGDPDGGVTQSPIPINLGSVAEGQIPEINGTGNVEDFHPMKGPMTTQTLRGLATHGHMHWRGDRVAGFFPVTDPEGDEDISFENFIVAFPGLVGGDTLPTDAQLQSDVQDFSAFMLDVMLPPNPVRAISNTLTTAQQNGLDFYLGNDGPDSGGGHRSDGVPFLAGLGFTCEGCHTLNASQGHFGGDGKQSFENEKQIMKIPHLRNMYQKVGMFGMPNVEFNNPGDNSHQGDQVRGTGFLHDGSTDTLFRFFTADVFEHQDFIITSVGFEEGAAGTQQRQDVEELMLAFDSDLAPAVGQQITYDASAPVDTLSRILLLEARAAASFTSLMLGGTVTECDLVVKARIAGEPRGYAFNAGAGTYTPDRAAEGALTPLALRTLGNTAGQELTYTCAPPGSGTRMGIDRDEDGALDSDERDALTDPANPGSIVGACNDGIDNDGDGTIDLADDGCKDATWNIENPQCSDGYDNDNDGNVDAADGACAGKPFRNKEKKKAGCGLIGLEPLVVLGALALRRRRRRLA